MLNIYVFGTTFSLIEGKKRVRKSMKEIKPIYSYFKYYTFLCIVYIFKMKSCFTFCYCIANLLQRQLQLHFLISHKNKHVLCETADAKDLI